MFPQRGVAERDQRQVGRRRPSLIHGRVLEVGLANRAGLPTVMPKPGTALAGREARGLVRARFSRLAGCRWSLLRDGEGAAGAGPWFPPRCQSWVGALRQSMRCRCTVGRHWAVLLSATGQIVSAKRDFRLALTQSHWPLAGRGRRGVSARPRRGIRAFGGCRVLWLESAIRRPCGLVPIRARTYC